MSTVAAGRKPDPLSLAMTALHDAESSVREAMQYVERGQEEDDRDEEIARLRARVTYLELELAAWKEAAGG